MSPDLTALGKLPPSNGARRKPSTKSVSRQIAARFPTAAGIRIPYFRVWGSVMLAKPPATLDRHDKFDLPFLQLAVAGEVDYLATRTC